MNPSLSQRFVALFTVLIWANASFAVNLQSEEGAIPPKELYMGVETVKFSPDGKCLACYYREAESVTVYNSKDMTKIASFKVKSQDGHPFLAFSPDSRRIVNSDRYTMQVFQLPSGELEKELGEAFDRPASMSAVFTADGTQLAAGNFEEVVFWDIGTLKLIKKSVLPDERLKKKGTSCLTNVFSNGKQVLAISRVTLWGALGGNTVVWDPVESKTIHTFEGEYHFVSNNLKILGTLRSIANPNGSGKDSVSIWEVETGKLLCTLSPGDLKDVQNPSMTAFAVSDDNQKVLFFKKPNDFVALRISNRQEVFRKSFAKKFKGRDFPDFVHDIDYSPANNGQVAVGKELNILDVFEIK
jgi:WD40 repeat protein